MSDSQPKKMPRAQTITEEVIGAYKTAGWEVQTAPRRAPMTFTAKRGEHYHHVKVVDAAKEKNGGADPSDVAKSDFVQNAISNVARPVYATYNETSAGKIKINFKDVNTGGAVRIATAKKKEVTTK